MMVENAKIEGAGFSAEQQKKQEEELARRKELCRQMIGEVMSFSRNYLDAVLKMVYFTESGTKETMTTGKYQEKLTEVDERRRAKHDALIDSIAIANRYIRLNFGVLSDDDLEKFIEESKKRKQLVLSVQRVTLPIGIIFPESMNAINRQQVADWAMKLAEEMKLRDQS